jgi:hypothetical protein
LGVSFDGESESVTNLKEVSKISTRIFMCLSTKLASLLHADESWLEFKCIVPNVNRRSSADVGRIWSREFMEGLVNPDLKSVGSRWRTRGG